MLVKLKGLNRVKKRLADGTVEEYYYRGKGKGSVRIYGKPGSPEFLANYYAAAGASRRAPEGQFRSLIDKYVASPAFLDLAKSTRKDYNWHIRKIEKEFGDLPISTLKDRAVRGVFLEWRDRVGARSARQGDFGFAVLRRIVSWAYDRGLAPANPCLKPGRLYRPSRSEKVWTDGHEQAFYDHAPKQLHLALKLALWTGQRQGDLLALTWSAYDGKHIRLKQQKTGARVVIPVGRPLKEVLEAAKSDLADRMSVVEIAELPILTSFKGAPWDANNFRARWRQACDAAGILGLTFHDLRGTAVTRFALAGCTVPEIATMTGHSLQDVHDILEAH